MKVKLKISGAMSKKLALNSAFGGVVCSNKTSEM